MPASDQRTARIAGLWFIGTFLFSIPALLLYDPVLNDPDYVLGDGLDARVSLGAFLEILTAICNIATAVVLFRVTKRVSESVALGYVALRTVEATMILVGVLSLMSVVTLRDDLVAADGSVGVAGHTLVTLHDWTFLLGPQFCAGVGTGVLLGYLRYKSELVPRRMAMLGLIGGPLAFVGGVLVLFGAVDQPSAPLFAFTAIEIAWELSLGFYLTFKGFRPGSRFLETEPVHADPRSDGGRLRIGRTREDTTSMNGRPRAEAGRLPPVLRLPAVGARSRRGLSGRASGRSGGRARIRRRRRDVRARPPLLEARQGRASPHHRPG